MPTQWKNQLTVSQRLSDARLPHVLGDNICALSKDVLGGRKRNKARAQLSGALYRIPQPTPTVVERLFQLLAKRQVTHLVVASRVVMEDAA